MKKVVISLTCILSLLCTSCDFINGLFLDLTPDTTRVDHITQTFSITDDLLYMGFRCDGYEPSTFVIDPEKKDILSRIYYGNNDNEYRPVQVKAYENRLWMLGTTMSKKLLIFNTETGKTEKVITFEEGNVHKMNFLPSLDSLAVMHGYGYDQGCSVSLISLSEKKYKRIVYIRELAPNLLDKDGLIYGSLGDSTYDNPNHGFGTYSLDSDTFNFTKIFFVDPDSDALLNEIADTQKFLILDDGTYIVCDNRIGLRICYPDKSESELYIDDVPYDPYRGNYKRVENIYYSKKYDRIYVGTKPVYLTDEVPAHFFRFAEKDNNGKWKWNEETILPYEQRSLETTTKILLNKETIADTFNDGDYFVVRFYDIETFEFQKEVRWNLLTDAKQ